LARIQQNILKRLIEKELIKQAVGKAGVTIGDKEIDAAFVEYKKRFQTEEQFDNYLKHGRVTLDSIKARITEKKALEKLIEAKGNLEIGDKELQEFYAKNERFYIEKSGVKASHILVKVAEKAKAEDEKRALDKVKQIRKELKAGGDFAELAKKFSEGPSAPKGGDLGFFGQGQMVKDFEEVAFKMKVGDISGPVRTRFGFHVIKVLDKREERKKPFSEVKEQISQSLKNKKFFQERRKLLESLRKEAKVEKRLEDPKPAAAPKKPVTIDKIKGAKLVPTKAAAPKPGAKPAAAPTK
jgi:parvulin-like peptidyl-prolyl isomerase